MALAAIQSLPRPRPTPASRRGLIARTRLVRRLMAARDTPLVLIVSPAGYGKTTLISQWAARDSRAFVWVQGADLMTLGSDTWPGDDDAVLVLDGAEAISDPESIELIAQLIQDQGADRQVVVASRTEPALGLGSLRAERKLLELRSAELAMDTTEAAALIHAHGFDLRPPDLELLMQRTEGWPAGLYLACLAARGESRPAQALAEFSGYDRFIVDYVADELLSALSADEISFLERASVLGDLSGPLCDFVLERDDSARLLKALSRMNLMLVPLDRCDARYRYHRLFAQALRGELRRSQPQEEAALHRRASCWYQDHDDRERAIDHALAAGDIRLAGTRLWSSSAHLLGCGRSARLESWLETLSSRQIETCPELALTAAASALFAGDRPAVERWTSSALRQVDSAPAGERAALQAHAVLLRAAVAEYRVDRVGSKAEASCADIPESSAWFALGRMLQGMAQHLSGEHEAAHRTLEEGVRLAAAGFPSIQALCLAQLCLLAIERDDWTGAAGLAARAKAQVERSGAQRYATSALVYAVSAEVHAHMGRVEASHLDLREASAVLDSLVDFAPWYEMECRISLARAAVRLSDVPLARALLSGARGQLQHSPDATVARDWIAACQEQADHSPSASACGGWSLTTAELRVLQFLPTHLSFPEVAERLYVSANTVKTHARSVYRKLGARSRAEAVAIARDSGLLDESLHATVAAAGLG